MVASMIIRLSLLTSNTGTIASDRSLEAVSYILMS